MPSYDAEGFNPPAPVARVVLRDPESGRALSGVPMLIDSGADISLIPWGAAAQLALPTASEGTRYQVVGVEGRTTTSLAVTLELVVCRRRFSGRFLLIDQDVGILGRNILRDLSLVLDGPNGRWEIRERP